MNAGLLWLASQPASVPLAGVCLAVSFIFSGVEAGLLSVNPARLRARARAGEPSARRLERLLQRPERLLATSLLVMNFMDLAALALLTDTLVAALGLWGYAFAFPILLPVFLIGVRLLPKALFRRFPFRTLALLAGALELTSKLLAPLVALAAALSRWLGLGRAFDPLRLSIAREQFGSLVASDASLKPVQREMISRTLAFRRLLAGEVSRPLPAALADRADLRLEEAITFARENRSDVFVALDSRGHPAVLERTFDLLVAPDRGAALHASAAPVLVAAPDEPAHRVLRRMRAARREVAAVVRDGRAVGIVRVDDLLHAMLGAKPAESPIAAKA